MIKSIRILMALCVLCLATSFAAHAQGVSRFSWRGNVDGAATVFVRGHHMWVGRVSGRAVSVVSSDFDGSLPKDGPVVVQLRRSEGRGQVRIVRQPTPEDNYTLAVRIRDPQPGSSQYHFVVVW